MLLQLIAVPGDGSFEDCRYMNFEQVDEDNSKEIELPKLSGQFGEFLKVFATSKAAAGDFKVDRITAGAFVALGGNVRMHLYDLDCYRTL